MDLSADGRLLATGRPQGVPGRTGDVVSLLQGPAAGEWRRIVQAIDASTYLVDRPIPAGTTIVSIAQGLIGEVFQGNRIDIRGGRKSFALVFCGNHFGTRIIDNHLLGGESAFKLTACPTETPMMWGWTHAPFLGGVIERNIAGGRREGWHAGSRARPALHEVEPGADLHVSAARQERRALVRAILEADGARESSAWGDRHWLPAIARSRRTGRARGPKPARGPVR